MLEVFFMLSKNDTIFKIIIELMIFNFDLVVNIKALSYFFFKIQDKLR